MEGSTVTYGEQLRTAQAVLDGLLTESGASLLALSVRADVTPQEFMQVAETASMLDRALVLTHLTLTMLIHNEVQSVEEARRAVAFFAGAMNALARYFAEEGGDNDGMESGSAIA